MKRRKHSRTPTPTRRRTTLTLPTESLEQAERIAKARNSSISAVVGEALVDGLRIQLAAERSDEIVRSYQQIFSAFSEDEMMILDGIIPESALEE